MAIKKPTKPKMKSFPKKPTRTVTNSKGDKVKKKGTVEQYEKWEKKCEEIAKHNCALKKDYEKELKEYEAGLSKQEKIEKNVNKLKDGCKIN